MIVTWLAGAIAAVLGASDVKTASAPPTELAGTWDVEHVAVDREDGLHWEFRPDDPQLLGRSLIISTERVEFSDGKEIGCRQVAWETRSTTWGFLFAKGFIRPTEGGRRPTPRPDDFDLNVPANQRVTVYSLCPAPRPKTNPFPRNPWVAVQAPDSIALHYDNQVLLLLRRRPADAKPTPSFDCGKATSPTEKTICGSFNLAAWDRSVGLAFRQALDRLPRDRQVQVRRDQKEWVKKRDACGANADCVDDEQWRRVEELSHL